MYRTRNLRISSLFLFLSFIIIHNQFFLLVYVSIYVILWSCRKQRAPQLSSGEVIRLFNKVGVTVNKMDETDPVSASQIPSPDHSTNQIAEKN
jgi:hypothetical protein